MPKFRIEVSEVASYSKIIEAANADEAETWGRNQTVAGMDLFDYDGIVERTVSAEEFTPAKVHCPKCGNKHLQLVARQMVDVRFEEDGDHNVTDGPYGDVYWDDESHFTCSEHLGGCGWAGQLKELT